MEKTAMNQLIDEVIYMREREGRIPYGWLLNRMSMLMVLERDQILDAMFHALDEDGHTGDWKIKFVTDYYNKKHTKQ